MISISSKEISTSIWMGSMNSSLDQSIVNSIEYLTSLMKMKDS